MINGLIAVVKSIIEQSVLTRELESSFFALHVSRQVSVACKYLFSPQNLTPIKIKINLRPDASRTAKHLELMTISFDFLGLEGRVS